MLSGLGVLCGLCSGLLMALFYALIYLPVRFFIGNDMDSFDSWPVEWRVGLSFFSCVLLAGIFSVLPKRMHKVGVPFVIERLNYHNGNLPIWNAVVQFFTAAIGLLGGLSIGKEGPAVHLGATLGGYLAHKLKLPQYGVEVLLACGIAGAISAIFQTPLAGILFVFEVVFREYRQRYILPVLLSSVIATFVSYFLIGPFHIFNMENLSSVVLSVDMFLASFVLVILVTLLSVLFLQTQKVLWRFNGVSLWGRFLLIGAVTAVISIYLPEALGSGHGPLTRILSGEIVVYSLLILVVVKTLLTAFTVGLGIPGGMIGPTFIIGGLVGAQVTQMFESESVHIALFVLFGMAAMMAASFQAPLTALVAILEMTNSSEASVLALFIIVLVCLLTRVVFHQESVFVERMNYVGMAASINPFQRYLRHHSVQSVSENVLVLPRHSSFEQIKDSMLSVVSCAVFEIDGKWYVMDRAVLLNSFQSLDLGPQSWLMIADGKVGVDLLEITNSQSIELIEEPETLESMLVWFQTMNQPEVLVALPDNSIRLVSRQQLDQFLLRSE